MRNRFASSFPVDFISNKLRFNDSTNVCVLPQVPASKNPLDSADERIQMGHSLEWDEIFTLWKICIVFASLNFLNEFCWKFYWTGKLYRSINHCIFQNVARWFVAVNFQAMQDGFLNERHSDRFIDAWCICRLNFMEFSSSSHYWNVYWRLVTLSSFRSLPFCFFEQPLLWLDFCIIQIFNSK